MDCGLLRKAERGVYETTDLGKDLVQLVKKATKLCKKAHDRWMYEIKKGADFVPRWLLCPR